MEVASRQDDMRLRPPNISIISQPIHAPVRFGSICPIVSRGNAELSLMFVLRGAHYSVEVVECSIPETLVLHRTCRCSIW